MSDQQVGVVNPTFGATVVLLQGSCTASPSSGLADDCLSALYNSSVIVGYVETLR